MNTSNILYCTLWLAKSSRHIFPLIFLSLSNIRLDDSTRAAAWWWQAITGRLRLCGCLYPSLGSDGVKQRDGNSLSGLLESCYQVLDFTEMSFRHTRNCLGGGEESKAGGRQFIDFILTSWGKNEEKIWLVWMKWATRTEQNKKEWKFYIDI